MIRKKVCVLLGFLLISCAGCGGPGEMGPSGQMSVYDGNLCFTEEGVVYQDPAPGALTGYFDYKTRSCLPLCANSNCLHDSEECLAVYLNEHAGFIGRIGDQWYYHVAEWEEGIGGFHCCDLDGGNDKIVGHFPHWKGDGLVLFYDQVCVLDTWDVQYDEADEEVTGNISGIYRFHLDTGECETLCPERETENGPAYRLCGKYGNDLFYTVREGERSVLKQMDLETKEVTEPFGNGYSIGAEMEGNYLLCWSWKPKPRLIEWNLETGEQTEIPEPEGDSFWSDDLKVITKSSPEFSDERFWTYRYQDDGTCELIRQGERDEEIFLPIAKKGSLILGRMIGQTGGYGVLAYMEEEDFLAGNSNWTVVAGRN